MPTIEFSSVAMNTVMTYLYSVEGGTQMTVTTAEYYTPLCAEAVGTLPTRIGIYKGTRPTTRQSSITSVSADLLVGWRTTTSWTTAIGPVTQTMVGTTHTIQIISNFVNASASGTATWFALSSHNQNTNIVYGWLTGTVGLPGSGADLIIADTNIVSGQPYKVANLTLTQSSVFTY